MEMEEGSSSLTTVDLDPLQLKVHGGQPELTGRSEKFSGCSPKAPRENFLGNAFARRPTRRFSLVDLELA